MTEAHSDSGDNNEQFLEQLNNKPSISIPMSIEPGQLVTHKHHLLYCLKNELHVWSKAIDQPTKITLEIDINDICWSSSLNQFLVLSNNELYSLDLETGEVTIVQTLDNVWKQCTSNEHVLVVSTDNYGANIEVYSLTDWKLLQRFEPPLSVEDYQYTTQLEFNRSGTKLAVALASRDQLFFQIRNPHNMNVLHSIDLVYSKGCLSYHISSLPNDDFLVNAHLEKQITLINSEGEVTTTILYNDGNIVSAAIGDGSKKYLVLHVGIMVVTQMDDCYNYMLHFFDL